MLQNIRTYNLVVELYRKCLTLKLPRHLKDQLSRCSSSVVLNIAEGMGKRTNKDKTRYLYIAFGSLKETQALLDISPIRNEQLIQLADMTGAYLYKFIKYFDPS